MSEDRTKQAPARYDRIVSIYDAMEVGVERLAFRHWRSKLWDHIEGERVLEVGVGTGKNIPYHPVGVWVAGIDISAPMLKRGGGSHRSAIHSTGRGSGGRRRTGPDGRRAPGLPGRRV